MYTVGVVFINCCIIDVTSVFDLADTHATVFIKPHLPKLPHLSWTLMIGMNFLRINPQTCWTIAILNFETQMFQLTNNTGIICEIDGEEAKSLA